MFVGSNPLRGEVAAKFVHVSASDQLALALQRPLMRRAEALVFRSSHQAAVMMSGQLFVG